MTLLYRLVVASACPGTHHRIAMDALLQLRGPDPDGWLRLFLNYYEGYLRGAKAPDDEFKDFKNHVLHVRDGFWGGAVSAANLWYDRVVMALRREYWADAVYAAGVLSHYVTDPLMPLHTGQTEEEGKVHRAVEWSVTKSYDELRELIDAQGGFPTVTIPEGPTWLSTLIKQGAVQANEHYFAVLEHYNLAKGVQDPRTGMDEDLKRRMAGQIALAVATFGRVLDQAIRESRARPPMVELLVETFLATVKLPLRALMKRLDDAEDREQVEEIYEEVRRRGKAVSTLPEDDAEVRRLHCEQVLRMPLAQLDAAPARATGMKYRLGESSGGRVSDAASARRWDRAGRTASGRSELSTAGGSSAAGSEAASRVPVPTNRLPSSGGSRRFGRYRRRRAAQAPPTATPPAPAAPSSIAPLRGSPLSAPRPSTYDAGTDVGVDALVGSTPVRRDVAADRTVRRDGAGPPSRDSRRWTDDRRPTRPERSRPDDEEPEDDAPENERPEDDERLAGRHDERGADDEEEDDDEDDDAREVHRPGRFRRRMKLQAAKATRAMKRGVQRGIIAPAAALGRAMKNVAGRVRFRRRRDEDAAGADDGTRRDAPEKLADAETRGERTAARSGAGKSAAVSSWKFYLNESQPVVDAPSIGGKTARRLETVGIHTVADLLDADPESLAAQLDVHWADTAKIVQWQTQAELAVRIPQLRGHDAQILTAVGITSTDELATMDVASLWELVEPFLKTEEAEQILRGGSRPDREEVAQWLEWSHAARPRA